LRALLGGWCFRYALWQGLRHWRAGLNVYRVLAL
jgi:hypothetical protein